MTFTISGTEAWLLIAVLPFLIVCATVMLVALLYGPSRGGFRLILTWPWVVVVLPTVVAGIIGIGMELTA